MIKFPTELNFCQLSSNITMANKSILSPIDIPSTVLLCSFLIYIIILLHMDNDLCFHILCIPIFIEYIKFELYNIQDKYVSSRPNWVRLFLFM